MYQNHPYFLQQVYMQPFSAFCPRHLTLHPPPPGQPPSPLVDPPVVYRVGLNKRLAEMLWLCEIVLWHWKNVKCYWAFKLFIVQLCPAGVLYTCQVRLTSLLPHSIPLLHLPSTFLCCSSRASKCYSVGRIFTIQDVPQDIVALLIVLTAHFAHCSFSYISYVC